MTLADDLTAVLSAHDKALADAAARADSLSGQLAAALGQHEQDQARVTALGDQLAAAQARIAELEAGTPPPIKPRVLIGCSVDRNPSAAALAADEAIVGPCDVARMFYGDKPLLWSQMGAVAGRSSVTSVKFYARKLTRAQIRSEVLTYLDAAPADGVPRWLMDDHEKDLKVKRGVYSLAQGADDTNYMMSLVKEHGHPDFHTVLLLTGFDARARFAQWAPLVDQAQMDAFGFDFYRGQKATDVLKACTDFFGGKPLVVGEFGAGIINGARGTDAERAAFIRTEGLTLLADPRVRTMSYFQFGAQQAIAAGESLSIAAWAAVRAAA